MKTILLISPYWKEEHRWMVSTVKLAELWQRLGFRVVVACMGPENGAETVSPTLMIHRKKDFFFPDPWNYGIALGFSGFVRRIVREEKPDFIVVNKLLFWTSLSAIPLTLSRRRPIVLTDTFVGITWWPQGILPRIGAAIYAWTLGWLILLCAKRVVLFHPQSKGLLKRLGIAKKTQVIPTGIDPAPYGIGRTASDRVTLTYVGRLESVKGVEDFLAAATSVLQDFPQTHVQVVGWYPSTSSHSTGSGQAGQANHPLVNQYQKQVTFTGLRHDIPDILRSTDIFVLPSYSEGLSNALQEAMASGCACIASEVGGNRFLIVNGVSGLLFPAGDREALRAHLRRLIEDPTKRRSLGEAARKRIEETFDWKVVGEEYRILFKQQC
ncbi:MAG: glycosyltransferase family 4 protein [Candidatus Peregrinibacteria bacterium]